MKVVQEKGTTWFALTRASLRGGANVKPANQAFMSASHILSYFSASIRAHHELLYSGHFGSLYTAHDLLIGPLRTLLEACC